MARPNTAGLQGVSLHRNGSSPFRVIFTHPLSGFRVNRSLEIYEPKQARILAEQLAALLATPAQWGSLPDGFPSILRAIWAVTPRTPPQNIKIPVTPLGLEKLIAENKELKLQLIQLQAEVERKDAMLRQAGKELEAEYVPKTLEQALEHYLSPNKALRGIKGGPRQEEQLRAWITRFIKPIQSKYVHEIIPQTVIEHLANLELAKTASHRTIQKCGFALCAFLDHQSGGSFKQKNVKNWMRQQLNPVQKQNCYWLDLNQVQKLCAAMPEPWRYLAMLQFGTGLRPEELIWLQTSNIDGDRIEITDCVDANGKVLWKPKTPNSYGKVHVADFAIGALKYLMKRKAFLLFPNDDKWHGGRTPRYAMKSKYSAFHRENKLWEPVIFTKFYRDVLRQAATKAGLDPSQIDSRTLRRSCGKRVLLDSNYNMGLTAAILRDTVDVVTKHYAKLLPHDVKQPKANKR